jgi:hypothetical protein
MRHILACLAVTCLAAAAQASPAAKAELVTPVQLGLYESDADSQANITLTEPALNETVYRAAMAGQADSDLVAFAKLPCTQYMLMMRLSQTVSGKPFIASVFVRVADATHLKLPEMTPRDDPANPVPFISENIGNASSPKAKLQAFKAVAAKGCSYAAQYKLGKDAEELSLQQP